METYFTYKHRTKTNKMTALQTLIIQLHKKLDTFPEEMKLRERGLYDGYLNAINMANALIGEEKQQIVDAYNSKFEILKQEFLPNNGGLETTYKNGIKYYNQLINKEK